MPITGTNKHLTVINNYSDARDGELVVNTSVYSETQVGIAGPKGTKKIDLIDEMKARVAEELGLTNSKVIYGFEYNQDNSNPATNITYTDDAAKFNPIQFRTNIGNVVTQQEDLGNWTRFIKYILGCKPCLFQDGILTNYLNPNDYTKDINGTTVTPTATGSIVYAIEFNKVWYKMVSIDNKFQFKVANYKVDSTYICDAFVDNGVEMNKMYISCYPIRFNTSTHLANANIGEKPFLFNIGYSFYGIPHIDTMIESMNNVYSIQKNVGATFDAYTYKQHNLIRLLSVLVCKTMNLSMTQTVFANNIPKRQPFSVSNGSSDNLYGTPEGTAVLNNSLANTGLFSFTYIQYNISSFPNRLRLFGIDGIFGELFKVYIPGLVIAKGANSIAPTLLKNTVNKKYGYANGYTVISSYGENFTTTGMDYTKAFYGRWIAKYDNAVVLPYYGEDGTSSTTYLASALRLKGHLDATKYSYLFSNMASDINYGWSLFNTDFSVVFADTSVSTCDSIVYLTIFK